MHSHLEQYVLNRWIFHMVEICGGVGGGGGGRSTAAILPGVVVDAHRASHAVVGVCTASVSDRLSRRLHWISWAGPVYFTRGRV